MSSARLSVARPSSVARITMPRAAPSLRKAFVVRAAGEVEVEEAMGEDSRLVLKVKVPKEICQASYNEVISEIGSKMQVPGFRKGKGKGGGPKMLVNTYGLKNVKAAVVENVLHKTVPDALAKVADRALDESEKIETDMDVMLTFFGGVDGAPSSDFFEFSIGLDVVPELKWLKDYKGITAEVESAGDEASIQAEADQSFASLVKDKKGTMRVVANRGLGRGDIAVINLQGCLINEDGTDGADIDGVNNSNFRFDTSDGEMFLPGLVEKLIALKTGEATVFELKFPDDWSVTALQGKPGRFSAGLKELFAFTLPDLTDAIAGDLWPGATTIDQAKAGVLKEVTDRITGETNQRVTNAITDALGDMVQCTIPNMLLQDQGRQSYSIKVLELLSAGGISKEVLNTLMEEKMVQNFIDKERDDIERIVRLTMAVNDIQVREKIEVSTEEIEKEATMSRASFEKENQEFDEAKVVEQAKELLEGAKVIEWLKANNNITVKEYSGN